jgi:SAM-dependent methyltransferase
MDHQTDSESLTQAARYWAVHGLDRERRAHWETHPVVKRIVAQRRGGLSLTAWAARCIGLTGGRGLGLGVGSASTELGLLSLGTVSSFDLYDATPELIESARAAAAERGFGAQVQCAVSDVNRLELPADTYDVITFISSLHHVENLEHVLAQCHRALRPGGVLYALEYIGPNRFAFSPDHVELARRFYRSIRPDLLAGHPELPVPDPVAVAAADPTESVRSQDIIRVCREVFPSAEVIAHDVCLTIILWYGLNYDVLYDSDVGHEFVQTLLEMDQALCQSGRLQSYQAEIVARKSPDAARS